MRLKFMLIIFAIVLLVLAWCPWLKKEEAVAMIDAKVFELQNKYPNLCELTVYRDSIHKVPFGYAERVSSDCTVTDSVYGVLKSTDNVLVTFYKGILGMPYQNVKRSK